MKKLLLFSGLVAGLLTSTANAVLINITNNGTSLVNDAPFLGANNPALHLDWLNTGGSITPGQISQYNTITGSSLPQAVGPGVDVSAGKAGSINLVGYTYVTLHYGTGPGGATSGGGVQAFYIGSTTSFTFAQDGSGPNGYGGISSIYLFGPTPGNTNIPGTPDGGTTAALLGLALAGLALTRRFALKS